MLQVPTLLWTVGKWCHSEARLNLRFVIVRYVSDELKEDKPEFIDCDYGFAYMGVPDIHFLIHANLML